MGISLYFRFASARSPVRGCGGVARGPQTHSGTTPRSKQLPSTSFTQLHAPLRFGNRPPLRWRSRGFPPVTNQPRHRDSCARRNLLEDPIPITRAPRPRPDRSPGPPLPRTQLNPTPEEFSRRRGVAQISPPSADTPCGGRMTIIQQRCSIERRLPTNALGRCGQFPTIPALRQTAPHPGVRADQSGDECDVSNISPESTHRTRGGYG